MWPGVRSLHIRLRYGHAADEALIGRMISNARSLKELEGLCIDCYDSGEYPEDAMLQEAQLLTAILHQARRLQLLQVGYWDPNFGASLHGPTLSGVQHILLQVGNSLSGTRILHHERLHGVGGKQSHWGATRGWGRVTRDTSGGLGE